MFSEAAVTEIMLVRPIMRVLGWARIWLCPRPGDIEIQTTINQSLIKLNDCSQ